MAIELPKVTPNQAGMFLGGSHVGNPGHAHQVHLFIFPPRNLPEQQRRPMLYNFSRDMIGNVVDAVQNTLATQQPPSSVGTLLGGYKETPLAIMPDLGGMSVDVRAFGGLHTFLLVLDIQSRTEYGATLHNKNRVLISGFFTDNPIGRGYNGLQPALNDKAFLIVTHHTTVAANPVRDHYGERNVVQTLHDFNHIPCTEINQFNPNNNALFSLLPEHLTASMATDELGNVDAVSGVVARIDPGKDPILVGAEANSPRDQLRQIGRALHGATLARNPDVDPTMMMDMGTFVSGGNAHSTFASLLYQAQPDQRHIPFDITKPVMLGDVMFRYPDMAVTKINHAEQEVRWDTAPQSSPTHRNMMASLISDVMPGYLAEVGLAEATFRYNSFERDVHGTRGIHQVHHLAGLAQMEKTSLLTRFQRLLYLLQSFVFPTLISVRGDFDLMVSCSLGGGNTLVNLVYMEDNMNHQHGLFEVPNSLGGLRCPLVGAEAHHQSNTLNLATLATAILDSGSALSNSNLLPAPTTGGKYQW